VYLYREQTRHGNHSRPYLPVSPLAYPTPISVFPPRFIQPSQAGNIFERLAFLQNRKERSLQQQLTEVVGTNAPTTGNQPDRKRGRPRRAEVVRRDKPVKTAVVDMIESAKEDFNEDHGWVIVSSVHTAVDQDDWIVV
jgi:hypothetical protein